MSLSHLFAAQTSAVGFINSTIRQVMLSAPMPSLAAKLEGHILSIIASTTFEMTTYPFPAGATLDA
jgi:hypothetical protein